MARGIDGVVIPPPLFDQHLCLLQRVEDLAIKKLVPELAVERQDIAVGAAWALLFVSVVVLLVDYIVIANVLGISIGNE